MDVDHWQPEGGCEKIRSCLDEAESTSQYYWKNLKDTKELKGLQEAGLALLQWQETIRDGHVTVPLQAHTLIFFFDYLQVIVYRDACSWRQGRQQSDLFDYLFSTWSSCGSVNIVQVVPVLLHDTPPPGQLSQRQIGDDKHETL